MRFTGYKKVGAELLLFGFASVMANSITGHIYDDRDGAYYNGRGGGQVCDTQGDSIGGTGISSVSGTQLNVCLLNDGDNTVIATQSIGGDGSYTFDGVEDEDYKILLTTETCTIGSNSPSPRLPDGWNYEAENTMSGGGEIAEPEVDEITDGIIKATMQGEDLEDMDFAINKSPEAGSYDRPGEINPGGKTRVQYTTDNKYVSDFEGSVIAKITISLISGGVLFYDGAAVSVGDDIPSPDFTKFEVDPDGEGDVNTEFRYRTSTDDACRQSGEGIFRATFWEPAPPPPETGDLCGRVTEDTDNDGVGEDPISSVTLSLYDDVGGFISSMSTDGSGLYCFSNLNAGNYTVKETQPAGYVNVSENEGGDDNDKPDNGEVNSIDAYVDAGENDTGNDFVEEREPVVPGGLCGNVTVDTNGDTIGENPIQSVALTLYNAGGDELNTVDTNSSGGYCFLGLTPGNYTVKETQPAGYVNVNENEGGDDNDKPDNGEVNSIDAYVDAGENDTGNDFVERREVPPDPDPDPDPSPGKLCGKVFADTDNDNTGDTPLKNISVALYTGGTKKNETKTGTDGGYCFLGLTPGNYTVKETQPAGYVNVSENEGGDDNDKPDNGEVNSIDANVDAGENDTGNDFVERREEAAYRIGDLFWVDSNGNGIYDRGEETIPHAKVELLDEEGNVIASTKTDASGRYHFDVPRGKYRVRFYIPEDMLSAGYSFVETQGVGNDANKVGVNGVVKAAVEVGEGSLTRENLTLDAAIICGCGSAEDDKASAMGSLGILLTFFSVVGMVAHREEKLKIKGVRV